MKISIIGTGYVGLVSGTCLAAAGHDVVCVDLDENRVAEVNRGEAPIHEDGLDELLASVAGDRLVATTDLAEAVTGTELTMIAVGTPYFGDAIDLTQIEGAAKAIGAAMANLERYHVVVVKSTVVPGTTEEFVLPLLERTSGLRAGADFGLGMNPEFLREGSAVADFRNPDRIVLGGIDERTIDTLDALFAPFPEAEIVRTTPRTAEMIKYAANSLLATMISFTNEIANVCSAVGGIDVTEVMRGVHLDHRVTPTMDDGERVWPGLTTYLEAGCGFGGSCFPKDVRALVSHGRGLGEDMHLLDAVVAVNAAQPSRLVDMTERQLGDLQDREITVLGLAFKPGTDDVRESPALAVVEELRVRGANVTMHDPVAEPPANLVRAGARSESALADAVAGAEAIVVVTSWPEYRALLGLLDEEDPPAVIDGRRMFEPDTVARYEGIGLRSTDEDDGTDRAGRV